MVLKLGTARVALLLLIGSLVVAPACSTAGGTTRGDWDLPGRRSSQLVGEIRSIDARRGRLQVDLAYGGTRTVYFDRRTKVVGQGRRSVSSLRRGDDVRIRVAYDRRGTAWADRIEVYRNGWARNDRGRWDDRRARDCAASAVAGHGSEYRTASELFRSGPWSVECGRADSQYVEPGRGASSRSAAQGGPGARGGGATGCGHRSVGAVPVEDRPPLPELGPQLRDRTFGLGVGPQLMCYCRESHLWTPSGSGLMCQPRVISTPSVTGARWSCVSLGRLGEGQILRSRVSSSRTSSRNPLPGDS